MWSFLLISLLVSTASAGSFNSTRVCPFGQQQNNESDGSVGCRMKPTLLQQQPGVCQLGQVQVNGNCISLAAPGSPCQSSLQCIDRSTCFNGRCACSSSAHQIVQNHCLAPDNRCSQTQTQLNGVCIAFTLPGTPCQVNEQCLSGSTCISNMCTCPSGQIEMNQYCISCPDGQICSCALGYQQVQSNCVRSGDFSCPRGQVSVNGQCVSLVSPGNQCVSPLQCIDNSNCVNGICTCTAPNAQALFGYCVQPGTAMGCSQTQTRVNGVCVAYSYIDDVCVGSEQCLGGSTCINQQCTCPVGRYSIKGYCLVNAATVGGNCNAMTQVLVNGVCYNLVQAGQQCQISQQCIGGGQCLNSFCQSGNGNGQCKTYQVSVSGQCLDTVSIGQQCTWQQQCINNANCKSNRCQCNNGFTFNGQACLSSGITPTCTGFTVSANGQCLPLASMNQQCSAVLQCMGFSVCSNSICQCPYAYQEVNGVCRRSTSVNFCPTGQVMSQSGACLSMVGIGGTCQASEQCPPGTSCALGRCTQDASGSLSCRDPTKEVAMANGQPIYCPVQLCPADAQCEMAQQQFVCCRPRNSNGGVTGYCPSGQIVELLPSGSPKNCLQQACASGRVCVHSTTANGFVCCGANFG